MKPGSVALGLLPALGLLGCAELPPAEPPAASTPAAPAIVREAAPAPPSWPAEPPEAATPGPSEAQAMATVVAENSIFFARSRAEVDEDGRRKLLLHAQRLKDKPKLHVTLVGHTDDLGSRAYNLAIVEQRIEAVYRLLRTLGVPSKQLRRYAVGGERLSKACRSPECRRQMRRVELLYRK